MSEIADIVLTIKAPELESKLGQFEVALYKIENILENIKEEVIKKDKNSYSKKLLTSIEELNRQSGRSTALAKAALYSEGTFVVYSLDEKNEWKKKFPDLEVKQLYELTGIDMKKPVVFDHFVTYHLLNDGGL